LLPWAATLEPRHGLMARGPRELDCLVEVAADVCRNVRVGGELDRVLHRLEEGGVRRELAHRLVAAVRGDLERDAVQLRVRDGSCRPPPEDLRKIRMRDDVDVAGGGGPA